MKLLKKLFRKIFNIKIYKIPKLILRVPKWDRSEAMFIAPETSIALTDAYDRMVRLSKEVITPLPNDTPEDLASLMSQAACDREFARVIVYPIDYELRKKVEELLHSTKQVIVKDAQNNDVTTIVNLYPMFEFLPASIISNEELNSKTLIYKYKRSGYDRII
jgi:hypothetical protein